MVRFNADEIRLIAQLDRNGKRETLAALKTIETRTGGSVTGKIADNTLHKLSALSERSCSELVSIIKNGRPLERSSVIKRLAKARERTELIKIQQHSKAGRGKLIRDRETQVL